jgi:hypothetical protein
LRAARIRACADMVAPAVPLDTESEAVLGLAIGTAVVLLNFSEVTQAVRIRSDLVLHDRSDGCGGVLTRDVPPLGLLWIEAA